MTSRAVRQWERARRENGRIEMHKLLAMSGSATEEKNKLTEGFRFRDSGFG